MQFGPATRKRLFAVKSWSQTPRAFDSGASPSPSIEAYTVAEPTPVSSPPACVFLRTLASCGQRAVPRFGCALHRGNSLQYRKPLADQRRRPGHGHEIVEGEPDEEHEHDGIRNDQ